MKTPYKITAVLTMDLIVVGTVIAGSSVAGLLSLVLREPYNMIGVALFAGVVFVALWHLFKMIVGR